MDLSYSVTCSKAFYLTNYVPGFDNFSKAYFDRKLYFPGKSQDFEKKLVSLSYDIERTPVQSRGVHKLEAFTQVKQNSSKLRDVTRFRIVADKNLEDVASSGFTQNLRKMIKSNSFLMEVDRNLSGLFSRYEESRGWSRDFIERLKLDVALYASFSEFYFLKTYDISGPLKSNVDGVIKFITLSKSNFDRYDLPVEREMGIRIKNQSRVKIEPSNFSIEKENYTSTKFDVVSMLLEQSQKWLGKVSNQEKIFFTYGDAKSRRMYRSFGFSVDKSYPSKKFKNALGEEVEWVVLSASISDVLPKISIPKKDYSSQNNVIENAISGLRFNRFTKFKGSTIHKDGIQIQVRELLKEDFILDSKLVRKLPVSIAVDNSKFYIKDMSLKMPASFLPLNGRKDFSFRFGEKKEKEAWGVYSLGVLSLGESNPNHIIQAQFVMGFNSPKLELVHFYFFNKKTGEEFSLTY